MEKLQTICKNILDAATAAGAGKAFVTASRSEKKEFNVDGGEFSLMRTMFSSALSLTVIVDGKRGSAAVNRLDDEALSSIVTDAMAIAAAGEPDPAFDIAPFAGERDFCDGAPDCDTEALFDRAAELLDTIKERHPKIIMEQMIVSHDRVQKVYANTSGTVFRSLRGAYSADLMYSAHEGEESTSFFSSGVNTADLARPFIEIGSIAADLARVEGGLGAAGMEGKFCGVALMPPDCLASFMGDIADNFASDMALLDGTSIWKDSLGQVVADSRITVKIDPLADEVVCGERYTAEGFVSEPYNFIKDGVLESFTLSLYAANKTGRERAKNSSFSLIITPGEDSLEEIIAGIERGILLGRFSGGEPGASGDFSGVAKNSFLIENGKITRPVSEVMVSGNLADLLKNVRGISREVVCDGASAVPYIAFDGVTVAGSASADGQTSAE